MKILTVKQPWAHAILRMGKDVENRSRATNYRGLLGIHAGIRDRAELGLCPQFALDPDDLVYGAVIGTVEIVDCVRDSASKWAIRGQWHWILRRPRLWVRPVNLRGQPGLFDAPILEGGR